MHPDNWVLIDLPEEEEEEEAIEGESDSLIGFVEDLSNVMKYGSIAAASAYLFFILVIDWYIYLEQKSKY